MESGAGGRGTEPGREGRALRRAGPSKGRGLRAGMRKALGPRSVSNHPHPQPAARSRPCGAPGTGAAGRAGPARGRSGARDPRVQPPNCRFLLRVPLTAVLGGFSPSRSRASDGSGFSELHTGSRGPGFQQLRPRALELSSCGSPAQLLLGLVWSVQTLQAPRRGQLAEGPSGATPRQAHQECRSISAAVSGDMLMSSSTSQGRSEQIKPSRPGQSFPPPLCSLGPFLILALLLQEAGQKELGLMQGEERA
ncbi:unnamed protein product [Rangifer tarandus platyrhynchus]|uniref:Uncharacterized protein n=1 Tax=Rangifer tarandus platyrhynchus TaxID=3082113 RepID=A0ABN8YVJ3_RANTA|nr:unnamed protein product [Rangifer tarandus platyrhynchus]